MIENLEQIIKEIDLNYVNFLPKNKQAKILDIGFGYGSFIYYLQKKSYKDIMGIEIDRDCIDFVKKNITENVLHVENLEKFLIAHQNEYDLIILKQVIYYFPKEILIKSIRSIKDSLKPNGIVFVETFNGSAFTGPFIKYKDYKIESIFTEHSLKSVLEAAGLEVIALFGTKKLINSPKEFFWSLAQKFWESALKVIYTLERGLDPQNPKIFSKFLIAVAKKT